MLYIFIFYACTTTTNILQKQKHNDINNINNGGHGNNHCNNIHHSSAVQYETSSKSENELDGYAITYDGYLNESVYSSYSYDFNLFKTYAIRNTSKRIICQECFSLGKTTSNINTTNPSTGVAISFTGGDNHYCSNNKRRSIKINFIYPSDGGIFEQYQSQNNICLNGLYSQSKIYESNGCQYEFDIITSAACPSQFILKQMLS